MTKGVDMVGKTDIVRRAMRPPAFPEPEILDGAVWALPPYR